MLFLDIWVNLANIRSWLESDLMIRFTSLRLPRLGTLGMIVERSLNIDLYKMETILSILICGGRCCLLDNFWTLANTVFQWSGAAILL